VPKLLLVFGVPAVLNLLPLIGELSACMPISVTAWSSPAAA
jgi:hypothetical protein